MIGRRVWVDPMFACHPATSLCPLSSSSRSTLDRDERPFGVSAGRSPRPAATVPGPSEEVHDQAFSG